MAKWSHHECKIRHNYKNHQSHNHPHPIGQRVLPVAIRVATKVLERLDEASLQAKQGRQAQLADLGVGEQCACHERAVASGVLGLVPPIKDVQWWKVRRGAERKAS